MRIATKTVDKKIAIGLIGYESKNEISRALDGWVGHVDAMILIDGKFDYFDAPNDYSKDDWLGYCVRRYSGKCDVIVGQYAGDQVTKRQMYLDLAGENGIDFLIAVDTDEYVDPDHADFDRFYANLVNLSEVVPDRIFYQWVWIPSEELWPKQGNKFPSNRWRRSMKIHKDPGTMRFCCDSHYTWCPKDVTDEQIYKWQIENTDPNDISQNPTLMAGLRDKEDNPFLFPCYNAVDGVRVKMDRQLRTQEQIAKSEDWAFYNYHEEMSRQYMAIMKAEGASPPIGFKTWEAYRDAPHRFDRETGRRMILRQ